MRKHFLSSLLLALATAEIVRAQKAAEPVTPGSSPEARALLTAIYRISGRNTLSGQDNLVATGSKYTDQARFATGKFPAVWGSDFGYGGKGNDNISARDAMIAEAQRQFASGSLIEPTWRAVCPLDDEPGGLKESVQARLVDAQWQELLTPGTPLRKRWEDQVDRIAGYLRQLRDARIPVLWRPYSEANNGTYWWGGRPGEQGFAALYRQLFERLAVHHQLGNLIWVWRAVAPDQPTGSLEESYPGSTHCDILAAAVHSPDCPQNLYDGMAKLAAGKPAALGEVGRIPTPAILNEQPRWTWFMVWADMLRMSKVEVARELFGDSRTLSRGDPLPSAGTPK